MSEESSTGDAFPSDVVVATAPDGVEVVLSVLGEETTADATGGVDAGAGPGRDDATPAHH